MKLSLTEEQELLQKTARDFLAAEDPASTVRALDEDERGYSPELWRKMADLGWLGLAFPAKYGGAGGSFLDLTILLEEMGRALVPGPFLTTVVLCGQCILAAGSQEQKRRLLPGIASGDTLLTMALTEPQGGYDAGSVTVGAVGDGDSYVISGAKMFVPYANAADYLLCVTRTRESADPSDGLTIFMVEANAPGVTCKPIGTIGRDRQCEVTFDRVTVSAKDVLGELHNGWKHIEDVLQKGAVALCADMIGGTRQVLDMSVSYAKDRVQFGQHTGSFQAIQHICSDIMVALDTSQALTYEAASRLSEGLPSTMEVSMAKARAGESYTQATWLGIQIQGGYSYAEDHTMPLHFGRAKADEVTLGSPDYHREIIARELLD